MEQKVNNGIKLIAQIIESKPQKVKLFLKKQGIEINPFASKEKLQEIILIALEDNTFRDQFAIFIYDNLENKFSNATGLFTPIDLPTSLFDAQSTTPISSNIGGPFEPINFPKDIFGTTGTPPDAPSLSTNPTVENPKSGGFFGGFDLNSGLGFIKDTLNSVASIKQSDKDIAILNAQINAERENMAPPKKSNTMIYVVVGVVFITVITGGVYLYNKK